MKNSKIHVKCFIVTAAFAAHYWRQFTWKTCFRTRVHIEHYMKRCDIGFEGDATQLVHLSRFLCAEHETPWQQRLTRATQRQSESMKQKQFVFEFVKHGGGTASDRKLISWLPRVSFVCWILYFLPDARNIVQRKSSDNQMYETIQ